MIGTQVLAPSEESHERVAEIIRELLERGIAEPKSEAEIADYVAHCAQDRHKNFRVLVASEDALPVGWLGVMPWENGYATLHPMRWTALGWPSVVPGAEAVGTQLLAEAETIVPEHVRSILFLHRSRRRRR